MSFTIFMGQKENNVLSTDLEKAIEIFYHLFIIWNTYKTRNKNLT